MMSMPLGEGGDAGILLGADDLVGDEDVGAELGGDLGLSDGGAGEAGAGAGGELTLRDLGGLVGFEVRAELAVALREEVGHPLDVALHGAEVDDEGGGLDVGDGVGSGHRAEFDGGDGRMQGVWVYSLGILRFGVSPGVVQ